MYNLPNSNNNKKNDKKKTTCAQFSVWKLTATIKMSTTEERQRKKNVIRTVQCMEVDTKKHVGVAPADLRGKRKKEKGGKRKKGKKMSVPSVYECTLCACVYPLCV
jgi:hypothetical protein